MRRWLLLSLLACACSDVVASQSSPIGYGTIDVAHTAVVSILAADGVDSFTECTGTMVQAKNGHMYVLTAAHCCNTNAPSIVVASNDYGVGEQYVASGTPQPPAYAVTAGSVWSDSKYNTTDHDFCMLQFAATLPTIALPSANDGLTVGTAIESVGFGATDTNPNNSGRRHGSSTIDLSLTADVIEASAGGSSHIPGICEGDSGGPVLVAAGAAQASQFVVGVMSYATAGCGQSAQAFASRVSSELGTGGFITSYLADAPIGTHIGAPADAGTDATTPDAASDAAAIDSSADALADAPSADTGTGSEPAQTSSGGCNASNAPSSGAGALGLGVALFALACSRRRR